MQFFQWVKSLFKPKAKPSTDPGIDALMAVIRLVANSGKSGATILATGGNPFALLVACGTLIPDVIKVVSEYSDIPNEIEALNEARYSELLTMVAYEFGFGSEQSSEIIKVAVNLIGDVIDIAPKVQELVAAVHDIKPAA